nr:MAG TPA: hypothetical protein [Caudoviricetes sp.]
MAVIKFPLAELSTISFPFNTALALNSLFVSI